jgi:hypothetical protein
MANKVLKNYANIHPVLSAPLYEELGNQPRVLDSEEIKRSKGYIRLSLERGKYGG